MSTSVPGPPSTPVNIEPFSFGGYLGQPGGLAGVGFWPRVAARVIDLMVHFAVSFCTGILFAVVVAVAAGISGQPASLLLEKLAQDSIGGFVFALLGSVAYHTIGEAIHGSTVGKLALSMVVVQEDGSPCRVGPALIRSLGYFVDALFFGLIGYLAMNKTPQQQRHGDTWAHTIVCKRSQVPQANLRGAGRFVLGLFLGAMADSVLIMVGLLLNVTA